MQLGRFIGLVLAVAGLQLGLPDQASQGTAQPVITMNQLDVSLFETGYGLAVVDVPEIPPHVLARPVTRSEATAVAASPTCPFDVRAIVAGGEEIGSFATVVAEEESSIIRAGTRHTFGGKRWKIKSIHNDDVVIESGGRTLRCPLGQ